MSPGARSRLLVVAHGSADPRFAPVVEALVKDVAARLEPTAAVTVAAAYLDHGTPRLEDVAGDDAVVVPLLLSRGFHARVDIPARAGAAMVAGAVGPDPLLATALHDRLVEAGYAGGNVVLAAAGSSDTAALDDVRAVAAALAQRLQAEVRPAYLSAGEPRLDDIPGDVVASYLLAPGAFSDAVERSGRRLVSAPLGAHPVLAELILRRWQTCQRGGQVPGRTAPA